MGKSKRRKRTHHRTVRRRIQKRQGGVTNEEHLGELMRLQARAHYLPSWDYNNEYDMPDFLRYAEIQNSPGNRVKERLLDCLNNCKRNPGSPGCEAKCIHDEIESIEQRIQYEDNYSRAKQLMKKNIYKLKKRLRDKRKAAFKRTRRATRLKNNNPKIIKQIEGYI